MKRQAHQQKLESLRQKHQLKIEQLKLQQKLELAVLKEEADLGLCQSVQGFQIWAKGGKFGTF